jgi:YbgC/YbaW family acyl-CoA thioester hydrolase
VTEFRYKRIVQFAETDAAGIVHFSWYLRYMEEAEHAMWRSAGLSVAPADSTIGFPRVAASVEFHAPLRFEDEIETLVRVETLSRRSIKYSYTITRGDTKIATGTMTAVCVRTHPAPMQAIDLPEEIASKLR